MTNQTTIILTSKFDPSKISYNKIKNLDNGGKMISLLYDGQQFALQTPEMSVPYGMKEWGDTEEDKKYTLDLSFRDMDTDTNKGNSIQSTFNAMKAFETHLIDTCLKENWLKKKTDKKDVIEALFTPIIRHSKDQDGEITDKYPPTFSFKIPTSTGKNGPNKIITDVYDYNGNEINIRNFTTKGTRCKAIITPSVWCAGGKFGCSFRANVLKIRPKEVISGLDAFISAPEEEDPDLDDDEEVISATPHIVKKPTTSPMIEEEDEEDIIEEDEDEDEEFAPPPPTKVRATKKN
jgi:hypothetical protein